MINEQLGDCHEIMAIYCDAAPVKLMSGRVEEIMENHEYMNYPPAKDGWVSAPTNSPLIAGLTSGQAANSVVPRSLSLTILQ